MLTLVSEWRPMTPDDVREVHRIGEIVHPAYPENIETVRERLALFPAGCFVADAKDRLLGYAISHPSVIGKPPALDSMLGSLPDGANCLFLHDIALTEASRGLGLGRSLLDRLKAAAQHAGLSRIALVSVNNSRGYWQAQGFALYDADATLAAKLATYGDDAAYMVFEIA